MKVLSIILLCALSIGAVNAQSHYFDNCEENTTKDGKWGEWVYSTAEIKISYSDVGKSIGIPTGYQIEIFKAGQSHPTIDFVVYFTDMSEGWYRYYILSAENDAAADISYLLCNVKLSSMTKGQSGTLNIWTYSNQGVGFNCKD